MAGWSDGGGGRTAGAGSPGAGQAPAGTCGLRLRGRDRGRLPRAPARLRRTTGADELRRRSSRSRDGKRRGETGDASGDGADAVAPKDGNGSKPDAFLVLG